MCQHEQKKCARCGAGFECKVGNITECQCYGISFSAEERSFLEAEFDDCLCRACLLELKEAYLGK